MKTILLLFLISIHSIINSLAADPSKCFSSSGTHFFNELKSQDIIVKFDTILSAFDYKLVKNEIEEIGYILYNSYDTARNLMIFRQLNDFSTAEKINLVNKLKNVDTTYYPLVDKDGNILYYDFEKIEVGFNELASEDTILSIIEQNNCSIFYYHALFSIYTILQLPKGQDLFETMNSFTKNGNVEWVDLNVIGYGGNLNYDCEAYDTLHNYTNDFKLIMNTEDTLLLIDYMMPSSPCFKVHDRFIYSGDSIEYFGIYFSGDLTISCNTTDTVFIENFDPEKSVLTVNYYNQNTRCVISRQVYPTPILSANQLKLSDKVIHYYFKNNTLYLVNNESDRNIRSIAIYNLQGQLIKIQEVNDLKQNCFELGEIQKGMLVVEIINRDNSHQSFKILNE